MAQDQNRDTWVEGLNMFINTLRAQRQRNRQTALSAVGTAALGSTVGYAVRKSMRSVDRGKLRQAESTSQESMRLSAAANLAFRENPGGDDPESSRPPAAGRLQGSSPRERGSPRGNSASEEEDVAPEHENAPGTRSRVF